MIDGTLAAFVNAARYEPFRGGSYFRLPKKLQNRNAIINIQNKEKQCLRWVLRAALFPAAKEKQVKRSSSYPTEEKNVRDQIGQWISNNQETWLFCAKPLLVPKHRLISERPLPHNRD